MREYINVYQLNDIGNNVKDDDYFLISQDALSYKYRFIEMKDNFINSIDTTRPIYNANKLQGEPIDIVPPLDDYQLMTYDKTMGSWTNRELDIDAVFRFSKFEPTKFLRLNDSKEVITSDVYVEDLIVDTTGQADQFLVVDGSGSKVTYIDGYAYIDNAIDTKTTSFIPLLDTETARAKSEEARLESLINNEETRATGEEARIESKFDTAFVTTTNTFNTRIDDLEDDLQKQIDDEVTRATNEEARIKSDFSGLSVRIDDEEARAIYEEQRLENLFSSGFGLLRSDLDAEVTRATNEESRIETDLTQLINDEEDRAISEEIRIESLITSSSSTLSSDINDEVTRAKAEETRIEGLIDSEVIRATGEETRIENLLDAEVIRATDEETRIEGLIDAEVTRATTEESRLEDLITDEVNRATAEEERLEDMIADSTVAVIEILFPVGSVIMRPTNPGNAVASGGIGIGTWVRITGKSLIGTGSYADSDGNSRTFNDGDTVGTFYHKLTEGQMPSHSHGGSTTNAGGHSHAITVSSGGSHTHTGSTNSTGAHSHTGSTTSAGGHTHSYTDSYFIDKSFELIYGSDGHHRTSEKISGSASTDRDNDLIAYMDRNTRSAGSHNHSVSINSNGSHSHSVSINSAGSHSHTASSSTNGSHTHGVNISSTGSDQYHNNLHPVYAVPMWRRTA